jgi:xylose isomerase
VADMFISHIGSIDCFARGLRNAVRILDENKLGAMVKSRYSSYDPAVAKHPDLATAIASGTATLDSMHDFAVANQDGLEVKSGEQEKYDLVFDRSLK